MAKLTKEQSKRHRQVLDLLKQDSLNESEREFALENYHEHAQHMNALAGAFFTPMGLARDLAVEVPSGPATILDLCAGIGRLSWPHTYQFQHHRSRLICVELNPEYVAAGRKIIPGAIWVCHDALDPEGWMREVRKDPRFDTMFPDVCEGRVMFDCVISNPPFGTVATRTAKRLNYTGSLFEYRAMEVAMRVAAQAVMIVPQDSCPFSFSGKTGYKKVENREYLSFKTQTRVSMEMNCGIDTSLYQREWGGGLGSAPAVEVALIGRDEDYVGEQANIQF